METDDLDTFQFEGRRIAVSFNEIDIDYDPGYRIKGEVKTYFDEKNVMYQKNRKAILCVIRTSYTGTPYSGVAILHPKEWKKSNPRYARIMALRRAMEAFTAGELKVENYKYAAKKMMLSYTANRLTYLDPGSTVTILFAATEGALKSINKKIVKHMKRKKPDSGTVQEEQQETPQQKEDEVPF